MEVEEGEVRLRKIPSIVHRRTKQAIRTNHVKQTAQETLPRSRGIRGIGVARLEVLNNGSAVPDDLSASSEQGRNGGKLPLGQHLSFEAFVPRRQLPKGNASL